MRVHVGTTVAVVLVVAIGEDVADVIGWMGGECWIDECWSKVFKVRKQQSCIGERLFADQELSVITLVSQLSSRPSSCGHRF